MLYWFTFKAFEGKKTCLEGTGYLKSFVNGKSQYRCVRRKLIIPLHRYYYKYSLQCSPIGCTLCGILRNCLPVHCSRDLSTPPYTRVRHFVIRTADSPCPVGVGSSQAHWVEHSSSASIYGAASLVHIGGGGLLLLLLGGEFGWEGSCCLEGESALPIDGVVLLHWCSISALMQEDNITNKIKVLTPSMYNVTMM